MLASAWPYVSCCVGGFGQAERGRLKQSKRMQASDRRHARARAQGAADPSCDKCEGGAPPGRPAASAGPGGMRGATVRASVISGARHVLAQAPSQDSIGPSLNQSGAPCGPRGSPGARAWRSPAAGPNRNCLKGLGAQTIDRGQAAGELRGMRRPRRRSQRNADPRTRTHHQSQVSSRRPTSNIAVTSAGVATPIVSPMETSWHPMSHSARATRAAAAGRTGPA